MHITYFVERFIPNAGAETLAFQGQGQFLEIFLSLGKHELPLILLDEIHFVDQAEYLGIGAAV